MNVPLFASTPAQPSVPLCVALSSPPPTVYHMPVCVQSALLNPTVVTCFKHFPRLISSLRLCS